MTRSPDEWLRAAKIDADRRGLPRLKPLLAALADATRDLRRAPWNHKILRSSSPPKATNSGDDQ